MKSPSGEGEGMISTMGEDMSVIVWHEEVALGIIFTYHNMSTVE